MPLLRRIITVAVVAGSALTMAPPAANADFFCQMYEDCYYKWSWSTGGVDGYFYPEMGYQGRQEGFKVADTKKDGHSAVLVWRTADGSKSGKVWDHDGSNNGSSGSELVNIAEGKYVYIKLCVGEYSNREIIACEYGHHEAPA